MQLTAQLVGIVAILLALGDCQTTPGTSPSSNRHLSVAYGQSELQANDLLPQALVQTAPDVWLNSTVSGNHMLVLVDQSIPQSSINSSGPQASGLECCRTTRLHWFQTDLKQLSNGSFVSETAPIATYGGPMPGLNDIAHTYIFYLFRQPSNFTVQSVAWDANRIYDPISVYARMNFSTSAVADVSGVGPPIAANYMRVQNPNTTAYGTASNGTCSSDSGLTGNGSTKGNVSTTGAPTAQVTESLAGRQAGWTVGVGFVVLMSATMALL